MFGFFKKKPEPTQEEAVNQQMLVDKLKGVPYSPNYFRIEVRIEDGIEYYVAQKRYSYSKHWSDLRKCNTEEEAREKIKESKEYDYGAFLKEKAKKSAVVIRHIDV